MCLFFCCSGWVFVRIFTTFKCIFLRDKAQSCWDSNTQWSSDSLWTPNGSTYQKIRAAALTSACPADLHTTMSYLVNRRLVCLCLWMRISLSITACIFIPMKAIHHNLCLSYQAGPSLHSCTHLINLHTKGKSYEENDRFKNYSRNQKMYQSRFWPLRLGQKPPKQAQPILNIYF